MIVIDLAIVTVFPALLRSHGPKNDAEATDHDDECGAIRDVHRGRLLDAQQSRQITSIGEYHESHGCCAH